MKKLLFVLLGLAALGRLTAEQERGFRIKVLPTIQYHFDDIWNRTPTGRQPRIAVATKLAPAQPVHVHVLATNFAADGEGTSRVNFSVRLFRPDGSVGYEQDNLVLVPTGAKMGRDLLAKAQDVAVMSIDEGDPMGKWRLTVEAQDRIGGVSARDEVVLEVDASHLAEALPEGKGAQGPLLGFFEQVLRDNPWLLPHLIADIPDEAPETQRRLAGLLAYAWRDDAEFAATLPAGLRAQVESFRGTVWPVPAADPTNRAQLDVWWGRFFASGAYGPVRELVDLLKYHPYRSAFETYRQQATKPQPIPPDVYKGIILQTVVWSLGSLIKQDSLVRDYCEGMLVRRELPDAEGGWLQGIFKAALEPPKEKAEKTGDAAK
ncbi:MAG: hypothetical protein RIS54_14 [Verrucomicrobiota bacterium]|jgi:hypothetical protein